MIVFSYIEHIIYAEFVGWMIFVLLDFTLEESVIYFICILIGSLLPDIDHPKSKFGKKIKPLSKFLYNKVGHRTLTHSIFIITVIYFSYNIAFGMDVVSTGLMIGCVMHIFFDMFTVSGVPLAYPISNKRYKLH